MAREKLDGADLFCGFGGFTAGAEQSGHVKVRLAVNHWRTACRAYQANHPDARVICARIDDIDPRHDQTVPDLDILLASPECTHHSNARGGQPVEDQKRATPWHICAWAEAKHPRWIVVENVREFRSWGPLIPKLDKAGRPMPGRDGRPLMVPDPKRKGETFRQWLCSLQSIGYRVNHQMLCAADFGAPTTRQRLFIIAMRDDLPGDIPWPEPTHAKAEWRTAAEVIDWSKPCPSIFGRKRPLAEETLRRIECGLRKFCDRHRGEREDQAPRSHGVDEPMPTVTTFAGHGLAMPYLIDVRHGKTEDCGSRTSSLRDPLTTVTTSRGQSLCVPFLTKYFGTGGAVPVTEPLDTVTSKSRFGLALIRTMQELGIVDIGFRMLENDELLRAQGFPVDYRMTGATNKADETRLIGNAVPPQFARAICEAIGEADHSRK